MTRTGATEPTGTTRHPGSSRTQRPPAPDGGRRLPRRGLAVAGALAALGLLGGLVAAATSDQATATAALPAELAGLPSRDGSGTEQAATGLTRRLAAEPSVADVAVRAYGDDARSLVVLSLTPRTALTDASAGELVARVLGAAGTERGMADDVRSAPSQDGLALLTCSTSAPGAATCLSVESDRALVVLTSGHPEDPLELTARVREETGRG